MGAPKKNRNAAKPDPLNRRVVIRLTARQLDVWQAKAERSGLTLAAWARRKIIIGGADDE